MKEKKIAKKKRKPYMLKPGQLSDLPIPPGETLAEMLEYLEMSQAELARRMGRPSQAISEIINARKTITAQTALQLEDVLGIPAYLWLELELDYQLTLAQEMRKTAGVVKPKFARSRKRAA
jgi:HTH-type transcriptional regulator/antitoxin HigA